jgi:hypothetical protein
MIPPNQREFDAPFCPNCSLPMELERIMPTVLPKNAGAESQVHECGKCGATVTRTVRSHAAAAGFTR